MIQPATLILCNSIPRFLALQTFSTLARTYALRVQVYCVYSCVCPSYWEGVIKCSSRLVALATRTVLLRLMQGALALAVLCAFTGPTSRAPISATWR